MAVRSAGVATIEGAEIGQHILLIDIATGAGHFHQNFWVARHHQHAHAGRGQHETARALWVLPRKLLGHRAAPRNTHHVDNIKAVMIQ